MSRSESLPMRLDKTALAPVSRDVDEERLYSRSRTPAERLRHAELLRRINYGSRATEPMERVIQFVRVPWA